MDIPNTEGYDPNSLLARFEWEHIITSAQRHASARDERVMVIGERCQPGWHYIITPARSSRALLHVSEREKRLLAEQAQREAIERALP